MRQVVEMGAASACGPVGCGAYTVENIRKRGIRCRGPEGSFVPCPTGVGNVGLFVRKGTSVVPADGYGVVTTPNLRWGGGRPRTWSAVTKKGYQSFRNAFGRNARIEYDFVPGQYRGARAAGVGAFTDTLKAAVEFNPIMASPGYLIFGNTIGAFVPGIVDIATAKSSPKVQAWANILTGLAGVGGIAFGRNNSFVLGASLAVWPGVIRGLAKWARTKIAGNGNGAAVQPQETVTAAGVGQFLPGEKARLQLAVNKAFGPQTRVQGVGQLVPKGFETIVPSDFQRVAESSAQVAGGGAVGGPIGTDPFSAVG